MLDQSKGYRQRWIALACMGICILVISLDNTIMNLALPSIAKELGSSGSQLQWVVDAYVLAVAGLLLTIGYLGDRYGRKPTLLTGLVVFGLFSLGAALSNSTNMLIGMRALMGIGAATILPATLSILTATFQDSKERAQAIALWAAIFSLGMGIGPVVGGWLLDNFHWSWVFYINIPVIIIGFIGSYYFIENSKAENPRELDIPGTILSIGGLFALVYGIIQAGMNGWTERHVLYSFGAAIVLLGVFMIWEFRSKNAMLPLHFFKNLSFTGANIVLTLIFFGLMGSLFFLGQFLQSVQGYTPIQAGIRLLPLAGVSFISAAISARIAGRIGTKFTVALGILIAAIGYFYFAQIAAVDVSYGKFATGLCIAAFGVGLVMSPATNSVMGSIPLEQSGIGSALSSTTRQIGGAIGVAVLGTVLNSTYISKIESAQWLANLPAQAVEAIRNSIQGAHIVAQNIPNSQVAQMIINQSNEAFTAGARQALIISAIILSVSVIVTLFILPSQVRNIQEADQSTKKVKNVEGTATE